MTNGLVVVLGSTGKNFAAGMSGGIAYVLDETGEFVANRVNRAGVDLDPLADDDINPLWNLVNRHVELTGSARGKEILASWGEYLPKFVKVFPHEFKRVLGVPRSTETHKPVPGALVTGNMGAAAVPSASAPAHVAPVANGNTRDSQPSRDRKGAVASTSNRKVQ
jgi:hypothetical protein